MFIVSCPPPSSRSFEPLLGDFVGQCGKHLKSNRAPNSIMGRKLESFDYSRTSLVLSCSWETTKVHILLDVDVSREQRVLCKAVTLSNIH